MERSYRCTSEHDSSSHTGHLEKRSKEVGTLPVFSVQTSTTKMLCWEESSYVYACQGQKPHLLVNLECYLNKELKNINPNEPKCEELKLQVYSKVFGCFIRAFKTYQPLLSAIKKQYETNLANQQDQIRDLEPLRSRVRLVTEECDRRIQARWGEEQAEIKSMKCQIKQMKKEIEEAKEKEQTMQILVDHLQSELGKQYVQYKEECDARKMLIWQLNDLMKCSGKEEDVTNEKTDHEDPVQLHLALKVCREDLTKAQEELTTLRAEYWDVVPRRDWDALEENHKQTLAQLKTLQGDFDLLKTEYHTLLEVQKRDKKQTSLQAPFNVKEDHASEMQSLAQSNLKDSLNPGSDMLCLQGSREVVKTAKLDEEGAESETFSQCEAQCHLSSV